MDDEPIDELQINILIMDLEEDRKFKDQKRQQQERGE